MDQWLQYRVSVALVETSAILRNGTVVSYVVAHGELNNKDVVRSYVHNITVHLQFTDRLHSEFETNLSADNSDQDDSEITLNQYLFWDLNDCMRVGVRAEWMDLGRDAEEFNAVTVGLNYRATANLMPRPELRIDNTRRNINVGTNDGEISTLNRRDSAVFGIDAIWSY